MSSFAVSSVWPPESARSFASMFAASWRVDEESLALGLAERRPGDGATLDTPLADEEHRAVVARLADLYRACTAAQARQEAVWLPGGEWAAYVAERRPLYDALLNRRLDDAAAILRRFWRNHLGLITKEYASFDQLRSGDAAAKERFLAAMQRNLGVWRLHAGAAERGDAALDELRVPCVGAPWGVLVEGRLVTPKACRFAVLAAQASELARGVPGACVVEVGGGFGGFAEFLLRRGGTAYVGLDLPETLVLAGYWLLCTDATRRVSLFGERETPAALADARAGRVDAVLLPNFALPALPSRVAQVTVNTFSLSEMPPATLERTFDEMTRVTGGFLLHHNMDRAGVVNRGSTRTPASRFPVDPARLRLLHAGFDLFHAHEGDYREFLYQRLPAPDATEGPAC